VLVVQVPTFFFLLQKARLPIGKQSQGKSFVILKIMIILENLP
jgi:hypothetical protein